jgi:putative cardiolipin synthase
MVIAVALWVTGCASLPPLEGRNETHALANTGETRLARAIAPALAAHPGKTGIHALANPLDAFAARVLLAATAEKSLDVQYYIWRDDQTGYLLFDALWRAAERGVRVRLLLDDNNTKGLDEVIGVLDDHPNIEVRLYNPVAYRGSRVMNFLTDFERVNRRMHNKSFTADNRATIVGGRNVGDEYFGAGEDVLFADLDVIAVGPAVQEVSDAFDLYWNSPSAYPAATLVPKVAPDARDRLKAKFVEVGVDPESRKYVDAVRATPLVSNLLEGKLDLEWDDARVVRDDPAKTLDKTQRHDVLLITELLQSFGRPEKSFDLVSPYFVPGVDGTKGLASLPRRGVATRVLTNSLAATDVSAVHAGYEKWRKPLLEAGVKLYELKSTSAAVESEEKKEKRKGSSPESLHAKTFALDHKRIFVGSFNFDPRSALLNTEMGLVIDSPALASRLSEAMDDRLARDAYELRLAQTGDIEWIEHDAAGDKIYTTDPQTTAFKRAAVWFMSLLPIDWLL